MIGDQSPDEGAVRLIEVVESHDGIEIRGRSVEISSEMCDVVVKPSLSSLEISSDGVLRVLIQEKSPEHWAPIGSPLIDEFVCQGESND